mmetsp:Transcript_34008/g.67615  ORF Transcript_34008/g.67615 Transcript_34008/m.67615 type:complete len:168 (+) Transcript_34008:119-622(+)
MDAISTFMREAVSFLQSEQYENAEEAYALALEVAQNEYGEGDAITVSLMGHMARSCSAQTGKEAFAAKLLERQLFMYENEAGLQPLMAERLTCLQDLALAYRSIGQAAEADKVAGKVDLVVLEVQRRMGEMEARIKASEEKQTPEDLGEQRNQALPGGSGEDEGGAD